MRIGLANKKHVNDITEVHLHAFKDFFLSFLGRGFLKQLYNGFIEHPQSGVIIAIEDKKIIGFCAYSENLSDFYKFLIKTRLPGFAWYAVKAFVRKPKIILRLFRAFTYSKISEREDRYIELSSIGVLPGVQSKGVGSKMITYLYRLFNASQFDYIKLETDCEHNEPANYFYKKNNFVLDHEYITHEGRKMNEYRLYLKSEK